MSVRLQLRRWWTVGMLAGMLVMVLTPWVYARTANTPQPPLHVGRIWSNPEYDGAEGWSGSFLQYPGGIPGPGDNDANYIKRSWMGQSHKGGTYMMVRNWTDPSATAWEDAGSYFFRSMDYSFPRSYRGPTGTFDYLYPGGVQEYYRWTRPTINVVNADGTTSTPPFFPGAPTGPVELPDHGGIGPRPDPIVDPDLVTECAVYMWWRYIPGVELNRTMYAYPYGNPHQDYILMDYTFTNNGLSYGDTTFALGDAPVLTNQSIEKMLWVQNFDYRNELAGGARVGQDTEGHYLEPWGVGNHAAMWLGDGDDQTIGGDLGADFGDPSTDEAYDGLLTACDVILGPVFASAGPGAAYDTDDPDQPAFRMIYNERGLDWVAGKPYSPTTVKEAREYLADGTFQLGIGENYRINPLLTSILDEAAGPTGLLGYGPLNGGTVGTSSVNDFGWDLGWEEKVRIVQVMAAGAVDQEVGRGIGRKYNERRLASADPATWMSAEDIALVQTAKDTALKAVALAWWNFHGSFSSNVDATMKAAWGVSDMLDAKPAAHNQPFNVPEAPRPPGGISVADAGNGVAVTWSREAESAVDHDTKVADFVGYRVWRQSKSRATAWELIGENAAGGFEAVGSDSLRHVDKSVVIGQDYWYAVTAYDDGSQNWARPGKSLESARWWTWTGYLPPGFTAVSSGPGAVDNANRPAAFSLSQNAPNPFNPSTVIRFGVPQTGVARLVIYDVNGRVVRTLVDGTVIAGYHEYTWDGTDAVGRAVSSGVYVYRLTGANSEITKRMTLVR